MGQSGRAAALSCSLVIVWAMRSPSVAMRSARSGSVAAMAWARLARADALSCSLVIVWAMRSPSVAMHSARSGSVAAMAWARLARRLSFDRCW